MTKFIQVSLKILKKIVSKINEHNNVRKKLKDWEKNGKPMPPPSVHKQSIIKKYAKKYKAPIFIETGTYFGDMIYACRKHFDRLYSIELDNKLYYKAQNRFINFQHITIIQGDSAVKLNSILNEIEQCCIFWLDGHYSEGITAKGELNTPIIEELKSISKHKIKNHIILIDDARCFIGHDDYPTISELELFIKENFIEHVVSVDSDIIHVVPKKL